MQQQVIQMEHKGIESKECMFYLKREERERDVELRIVRSENLRCEFLNEGILCYEERVIPIDEIEAENGEVGQKRHNGYYH